jgi:sec-independent protein translocase protein TatA
MNQILLFLNLGGGEIIVVLLIVLLFFGSKKIPELARGLGRGMREFKDATSGVQREIEESMNEVPKKKEVFKQPEPPSNSKAQ